VAVGHLAEGRLEEDPLVAAEAEEIINNPSTFNIKIVGK
jgi:hypothetical protein